MSDQYKDRLDIKATVEGHSTATGVPSIADMRGHPASMTYNKYDTSEMIEAKNPFYQRGIIEGLRMAATLTGILASDKQMKANMREGTATLYQNAWCGEANGLSEGSLLINQHADKLEKEMRG